MSADEVQDVIASRLIPMVQERENLIDSGKSLTVRPQPLPI